MRTVYLAFSLIALSVLAGCAAYADPSIAGVSPQLAMDISAAVGAQKHAHHIYRCTRWPDGMIIIETDVGNYSAHRVGHGWQFVERIVTGGT
jgi:hypothetical protein